jgi:hypothetical protein
MDRSVLGLIAFGGALWYLSRPNMHRNPMRRTGALDKAKGKVRKLADAARGSSASAQSKAAYRRALDDLMQMRIDAGTQGTLFDLAPRQATQRAMPGLFD